MVKEVNKSIILSIVIPVYNCSYKLQICIESILKLKLDNIEIIIVNDGSTDATFDICVLLEKKVPEVQVLNNFKNEGPGKSKMNGLARANGEYVIFVDADDELLAEFSLIYGYLQGESRLCDCYMFSYLEHRKDNSHICRKLVSEIVYFNGEEFLKDLFIKMDMQSMWQFVYNRQFLIKHKIICPSHMIVNEDYMFNIQVYSYASVICCLPFIGYLYNYNTNSLTRSGGGINQYKGVLDSICYFNEIIGGDLQIDKKRKQFLWESVRLMSYSLYSIILKEEKGNYELLKKIEDKIWDNLQFITEEFKRELWIYPASQFGKRALTNIIRLAREKEVALKIGGFVDGNKESITSLELLSEGYKVVNLNELKMDDVGIGVYYIKNSVLQDIKLQLSETSFLWRELIDLPFDEKEGKGR